MKVEKSKNRGITLIALVITIIVLLILAGVSIATLTGQNGILTRATDSKTQTEIAEEKEAISLAYSGAVAEKRGTGDVTADDLNREFGTNGTNASATDGANGTITVTFDPPSNRVYTIDADGNISDPTTGEVPPPSEEPGNPDDNGIFQDTSTIDGGEATANNPTIPAGFRPMDTDTSSWGDGTSAPSAEDLGNGLVITDAPERKVGNEFVWIPVNEINDMVQCSSADGNCNIVLNGNTISCTTHSNTNLVGKLWATRTGNNFGTENTTYNANSGLREPALVTGSNGTSYDGDTTNNYLNIINGILGTTYSSSDTSTFLADMQEDFYNMAKSVEIYHGFYIGRYEMSKSDSNTAQSKANSTALTASTSSANRWYGLYAYGKKYTNIADSVESSMVWGSQYDAMMRWMQDNEEDVKSTNDDIKSTNKTITGFEGDADIIRNVYDLYGGRLEWTLEAVGTDNRVIRGRLLLLQQFT